ncbi:MAG: hypothetical protein CM1200mP40_01210 [Gammaproteobacteria bacterium]|nr:MAG: hypothetical protein CM1200mP40_01210 [Gammaproteobacteria bacterium]
MYPRLTSFKLFILNALFLLYCSAHFACSGKLYEGQYQTENGDCHPVWYGETASGAYFSIVIPANWTAERGLVFWNHGFQSFLTGFETNDLLDILNPFWDGFYTGDLKTNRA